MNTDTISLLLKHNKDPTLALSYQPMSPMILKFINKTLAHRIEKVISCIIHPHQTGFFKGRRTFSNIHRLFTLIGTLITATIIITLDAESL